MSADGPTTYADVNQRTGATTMAGRSKTKGKVGKVMSEWKAGTLHSGSPKGPKVTNQKQAVAIALSEQAKAGGKKRRGLLDGGM